MRSAEHARQPLAEVCAAFNTDLKKGLTSQEASGRRAHIGPNLLHAKSASMFRVALRQFASPFAYLLFVAAILAVALGEYIDGGLILGFIMINAVLGFVQEYRSERTLELLRHYTSPSARVLRGGKRSSVPAETLVPGDIVYLEAGDLVPADMRIAVEHGLSIDESVLTGESAPSAKSFRYGADQKGVPDTMAFSGTTVVSGSGEGIVVAIGAGTAMGEIAALAGETPKVSDFDRGIGMFSSFVLKLVLATLAFLFAVNLLLKGGSADIGELVLFSIALAVGVIPEALPIVTTFALSSGARRLARKKVIVRRLSAIEDLGGIEVLCTDKTGTITENALTLEGYSPRTAVDFLDWANAAGAEHFGGRIEDPFDVAFRAALPPKRRVAVSGRTRLMTTPFDPKVRLNAVLVAAPRGKAGMVVIRGALESVLARVTLPPAAREELVAWALRVGRDGRRVLAVATRRVADAAAAMEGDADLFAGVFEYAGAAAFVDPIKPSTARAIEDARSLGISIKMITGDSPEVAGAVAREIGLLADPADVLTGDEFLAMDHAARGRAVREHSVFARIAPAEKHAIVSLIRESASVGFLGEGINDAPALKAANVSIVVPSASDIARDVSDIVLRQRSLSVIVEGIREGRTAFANTVKYIRATLASNFGNFYAVAIISLFVDFLPMLPIQILLLNLLSDVPLIAVATDRVAARDLARPSRYDTKDMLLIATVLGIVSTVFDFILFGAFRELGPSGLQTNWFIGSLLTELAFVFSIRSILPFYRAGRPGKGILTLAALAAAAGLVLPYTGIGAGLLKFSPPEPAHLAVIFAIVAAYFASTEIVKALFYRALRQRA